MKLFTLLKKVLFSFIFMVCFINLSFGQNASNGGWIGIIDTDTVFAKTYFVRDTPDTIVSLLDVYKLNSRKVLLRIGKLIYLI